MNDPIYLRAELQRNSFLLAHIQIKSDRKAAHIQKLLETQKKKQDETNRLSAQIIDLTERLKYAHSQLYDITSDSYSSSYDSDGENCQGINLDEIS